MILVSMQGLVWGEPELAHEYDFDVENIEKFEVFIWLTKHASVSVAL